MSGRLFCEELGVIKLFSGKFAPSGWAFCDGQTLMIQRYPVLYSVIGNQFGGDNKFSFALPDLRGRMVIGSGKGGDQLSNYKTGQSGGEENVTLTYENLAKHNHTFSVSSANAAYSTPKDGTSFAVPNIPTGRSIQQTKAFRSYPINDTSNINRGTLNAMALSFEGKDGSHSNIQPSIGLNYIIYIGDE